jgi:hypothetical protein
VNVSGAALVGKAGQRRIIKGFCGGVFAAPAPPPMALFFLFSILRSPAQKRETIRRKGTALPKAEMPTA